jgi:hypothetical protein
MKYKINRLMQKALYDKDILQIVNQHPLERKLKSIIENGLSKKNDVVFLNSFSELAKSIPKEGGKIDEIIQDKTGLEMHINKFHIEDYVPEKKNSRNYDLQQGIAFAVNLEKILKNKFPDLSFKIIVSTDEGEDIYPEVCTVGFHMVRQNEHWLVDNLEEYKYNSLLVIET